jgi:transcriptional regulator with XRE-family HTH domain
MKGGDYMASKKPFYERAKQWRKKQGWSMLKLADVANVSAPSIMRLERGEGVRLQTWVAVGTAIGEQELQLIREYHATRGKY